MIEQLLSAQHFLVELKGSHGLLNRTHFIFIAFQSSFSKLKCKCVPHD